MAPAPRVSRPRCAYPTCRRRAKPDASFCATHIALDALPPVPDACEPGSYRILLDNELRTTLARATAEIMEEGLIDELGALRIVLLRVLVEEREIAKLVTSITRIVTVAAQAMRVQHAVSGESTTTMLESVNAMLRSVLDDPVAAPGASETEQHA